MPKVGLRIIKSSLAVFICFAVDSLRPGGLPFYSAIAAILCMQPDVKNSLRVAVNRTIGTLTGGVYGIIFLCAIHQIPALGTGLARAMCLSLSLIPLMYLTVLMKKTAATYITCVVFLSVTVIHGADAVPYMFALNRILDTLIGIFVSLAVNALPFLKNRQEPPGES